MTPLAAGIGIGIAALVGYKYKDKLAGLFGRGEAKVVMPTGGPSEKLEKGRTYTVLAVITKDITNDSRWNNLGGQNEQKIAQIIAATFGQSGFSVLNKPVIRDGENMKKAIAGEPSTWVFNGRWLLDGSHVTNVIPWLAGATFYLVPTA